ncbi:MAG: hypothetical protein ACYDCN_07355 [Bacteroidia bacterium]
MKGNKKALHFCEALNLSPTLPKRKGVSSLRGDGRGVLGVTK